MISGSMAGKEGGEGPKAGYFCSAPKSACNGQKYTQRNLSNRKNRHTRLDKGCCKIGKTLGEVDSIHTFNGRRDTSCNRSSSKQLKQ